MAHNDPFTLDLFGNTSLSSGLGLGVTAFPAAVEADDDDHAVSSPTPAPALPVASAASKPAIVRGENFHLDGDRGLAKSWRDRARDNLAAIRLAAVIEAEQSAGDGGRTGTPDPLHRLWRVRARQRRLPAPGRGRIPERLGGDRRRARGRLSTPGPTPRSPAAPSTPTSRRNTSSARSGRLYSGSASAAAGCSNPASAAACFRR